MKIGFWKTKKEGFFVSHNKGLNEEQIAGLQALKVGDKLKLWQNEETVDKRSSYTLGKMEDGGVLR